MNNQSQVQIDFSLQVGDGTLQASAVVPVEKTTLVAFVPVLQDLTSSVIDATVATVQSEGYAISCKAGCGACCRQLVPISLFEAEMLSNWMRNLPQEQQDVLESRFNMVLGALKSKGILDQLKLETMAKPSSPEGQQFGLEYLKAGVPCPFLQDESCAIHPIRPLVCREYLVTSPPEFCTAPTPQTVRVVPMPVRFSNALVRLGTPLTAEKQGWIPLIFLFSWMKSGISIASAIEMPGPELLRLVVEQVTTTESPAEADNQDEP